MDEKRGEAMTSETYIEVCRLREDRGTSIHRAVRASDRQTILLKVSSPAHCGAEDIAQLVNELEIGRALQGAAVLAPVAMTTFEGRPALELRDSRAIPLEALLGAPMPVGAFLDLASRIARVLAELHERGVIHKDLRPGTILHDRETGAVQLSGLGLARRVLSERSVFRPLRLIEGSLPYVSPEQTGRLNRMIDGRSDLYALGVVLYQLLTGRLPFVARDALGWVHSHVARRPSSPQDLVPGIPEMVSRILLRLLEKVPEDRYQTASGLAHDLARCQVAWRDEARIAPFALGELDTSDRFALPQKLYGRDSERATLLACLDHVAASHRSALAVLVGPAGVGKSALVQELQGPIAARSGLFVSGKFDQYRRDVPYAAIIDVIRELMLDRLAETPPEVADAWRQRLRAALGPNAAAASELIRELGPMLGPLPPAAPAPPAEADLRSRRALGRLIGAFAGEVPLTIFIDDVQWADAASVRLIADLLTGGEVGPLLVVAAHRHEMEPAHPWPRALAEIASAGTFVRELALGCLPAAEVDRLVADLVAGTASDVAPLGRAISEKTGGNPLMVTQLLTTLHRKGLIAFDSGAKRWRWDLDGIRQEPGVGDVTDLIVEKLRHLETEAQVILPVAACLGGTFDAETLAHVLDSDPEPTLQAAVEQDVLVRLGRSYRFSHDRVQEAAYLLTPAEERPALHLRVGRRLLGDITARSSLEAAGPRVFDVVGHLHRATALLATEREREQLAELDLLAGRTAQGSGAHASALNHFAAGASLLPKGASDAGDRHYPLWFGLELGRAQCERLTGAREAAVERLASLARRARDLVDQSKVVCEQAAMALADGQVAAGTTTVLAHLRRLGIDWAPRPGAPAIREEYERLRQRIGDRSIESLRDLPPLVSPEGQATVDVLLALHYLASFSDEGLMCLVAGRAANLTVELGQSDAAPLAFTVLGQMLGPYFEEDQAAFRFATLGLELLERRNQLRFRGEILIIAGAFVYPRTQPLARCLELTRRSMEAARAAGDTIVEWGAANQMVGLRFLLGADSLHELDRDMEAVLALARKGKLRGLIELSIGRQRLLRALRGLTPAFARFDDAELDECRYEAYLAADPSLVVAQGWYWIRKLCARFFEGDLPAAIEAGGKAEALLWTSAFALDRVEFHLYRALALGGRHDEAAPDERAGLLAAVREHARFLDARAASCPDNFGACAALVAADLARLEGDPERAMYEYERAIRSARDHGQAGIGAVALETASRFYRARGFVAIADSYLREARDAYQRWGADGKVRQLEARHAVLARRDPSGDLDGAAVSPEQLDLLAVLKASRAISGALVRDELLPLLLTVVLEHGGARRARIVLIREEAEDSDPEVAAEKTIDDAIPLLQPVPRVPESLLEHVRRTGAPVVLEDAAADAGPFAGDPYFARTASSGQDAPRDGTRARPRSVLCLPVRRQRTVIGLLYLENDLTPGVFGRERLAALELLAAQAAVSLENAHLLAREREARAQAEADRRRAVMLAEATTLMSSSPDQRGIAQAVRHLCAHGLADWASVDVSDGGAVTRLAGAHRDATRESALRRLFELYPTRVAAALLPPSLPEEASPVHLAALSDEQLRERCLDDRHAELVRELGVRSLLVVPLRARGVRLGVLSLGAASPHHFLPADVELAIEIGRRTAMALENARVTELESKLRQAQKMEAIGRLAGGVAHDFNNLLCVILSYAHLLAEELVRDEEMHGQVEEIRRAADRAAELTRQLLAFSRQQVLRPTVLDLTPVVTGMKDLLARLLGEDVELVFLLAGSPTMVRADRGQLGQVLMNLAVNARDAMPGGGTLTIETGTVEIDEARDDDGARAHPGVPPGSYVRLSVTDTGCGMSPDTQARIFEPFFTTKDAGKGTGLGLATVLGVVQQSGGQVVVDSEPGRGTTFSVYLPRFDALPDGEQARAAAVPTATSGTETVLLVEDNEQVRLAARAALQRSGYTVLEAAGPGDALLTCEQHRGTIHVLLSDIQMPRMTGVELARRVRAARPGIRVLLMSGYAEGSVFQDALGEARTAFLQKPVTPDALARGVREVLDTGDGSGARRSG